MVIRQRNRKCQVQAIFIWSTMALRPISNISRSSLVLSFSNIYAFNGVLSASAHTHHTRLPEERLEAFTILVSTFLLLREWVEPNDSTYILFFQACDRLLPKGHRLYEQVIETVVYSCVRDGKMSANVISALHATSPHLAQQFEKIDASII